MALKFDYIAKDPNSEARRGRIHTAHGTIETPVFMSVGTFGSVRTLDHTELEDIGVQIVLGNTYHLYLRPGPDILQDMGGYHKLICWDKPILTDSGGFQIFSLPHQRVISEKGVTFKSYIDQSYKRLTPESDIAFQEIIGSDIMMVLDVCVPSTSTYDACVEAMNRTHRWAQRSLDAHRSSSMKDKQGLLGIVQGGRDETSRTASSFVHFDRRRGARHAPGGQCIRGRGSAHLSGALGEEHGRSGRFRWRADSVRHDGRRPPADHDPWLPGFLVHVARPDAGAVKAFQGGGRRGPIA